MRSKSQRILAGALAAGALLSMSAFAASASAATTLPMTATAYGPTAQDNYPYGATDYFGAPLTTGDVAVDPSVIPLGTCLYITGYSSPYLPKGGFYGEADDTGGAIKGNRVDIYYNATEAQINQFGIQHVRVTILGKSPDSPSQASGTAACTQFETSAGKAGSSRSGGGGGHGAGGAGSPAGKAGGGGGSGNGAGAGSVSGRGGRGGDRDASAVTAGGRHCRHWRHGRSERRRR